MKQFDTLSVDAKVVYLLSLTDLIIDNISSSDGYEIAVEALEKCWEWVQFRNIKADKLYYYLENLDEMDIMTYMQIEEKKNCENVWICVANALAYTIWEAYKYEKEKYFPQTIECVDSETIESFRVNFNQICANSNVAEQLLSYLKISYSKGINKKIDRTSIKRFINNYLNEKD